MVEGKYEMVGGQVVVNVKFLMLIYTQDGEIFRKIFFRRCCTKLVRIF